MAAQICHDAGLKHIRPTEGRTRRRYMWDSDSSFAANVQGKQL